MSFDLATHGLNTQVAPWNHQFSGSQSQHVSGESMESMEPMESMEDQIQETPTAEDDGIECVEYQHQRSFASRGFTVSQGSDSPHHHETAHASSSNYQCQSPLPSFDYGSCHSDPSQLMSQTQSNESVDVSDVNLNHSHFATSQVYESAVHCGPVILAPSDTSEEYQNTDDQSTS